MRVSPAQSDKTGEKPAQSVDIIGATDGLYFEHHTPEVMVDSYHLHPSIEVNLLDGCDLTYSFGGADVVIPSGRLCVFWGAKPHKAIAVAGTGTITNAYLPLREVWSWRLPKAFMDALMSGSILAAQTPRASDHAMAEGWVARMDSQDDDWTRLHMLELQARLTRLALEGWDVLRQGRDMVQANRIGGAGITHLDKMLRYISSNYAEPISLNDISHSAGVSPNHAINLFKSLLGTTVKEHLNTLRINHARMLLSQTDQKVLNILFDCGFRSQSAFYEAFQKVTGHTPAGYRDFAQRRGDGAGD